MYIDVVPNRASPPAVLLRESFRDGTKIRKRTVANLSSLPMHQVEAIRAVLRDQPLASPDSLFEKVRDQHHGAVDAVRVAMCRLGFDALLDARASRERDLVIAMVVARIVSPRSKLATERWWSTTTLPDNLDLDGATEDDLYEAMDWLLERQERIEKKLAARHLKDGGLVLYDLSSSYFEGATCPLAALGHNRDGKKGKLQVNYGLLTDGRGCPVAISVFKGNTGDPTTLLPQVDKVRSVFGIKKMVIVGDRGMISQRQIDALSETDDVSWITALKSGKIRTLVHDGSLQFGLFDTRNLFEIEHPDFPKERLVACKNHELAKLRAHKRESMLQATETEFAKVTRMIENGNLHGKDAIGVRVGRVINKYKMAKHFELVIDDASFHFSRRSESIEAEAALDGIYVVRTALTKEQSSSDDTVRSYKLLSQVERAFRSFKTVDLHVRPIYHHLENRVRAHILLAMLAYYVEWHMKQVWCELLFADESPPVDRDPVAPAERSQGAQKKACTKLTVHGTIAHSFSTLLADLATITKSTCRRLGATVQDATFSLFTRPSPLQVRAIDLLRSIVV
ncbi:MAG TPA: IS1634 family transposase [Polyangiaceae bacterium]|nr:IS1634 family transposase [Polyangiaceae bacterium]